MPIRLQGKVYLGGPITGTTYTDTTDWRLYAIDYLKRNAIQGISPLRNKDYLRGETQIKDSYEDIPLSSKKGIYTRDRWDTMRSDAILINLLGTTKVSIGSLLEVAWADSKGIPIILVMEAGNIHDHAMVRECAGFIVNTLEDGLKLAVALLGC